MTYTSPKLVQKSNPNSFPVPPPHRLFCICLGVSIGLRGRVPTCGFNLTVSLPYSLLTNLARTRRNWSKRPVWSIKYAALAAVLGSVYNNKSTHDSFAHLGYPVQQ